MSQHRTQDDLLDKTERSKGDCIISFDKKFFMYKKFDNHPLQMQTLMRRFFQWMDDTGRAWHEEVGTLVAAFVFYVKREDEVKTKHLYPDWKKNNVMTKDFTLIDDINNFRKENPEPQLTYEVDLKKLTMFINDKANKKEATIVVGRIPDNDETTFGEKATTLLDRSRPKAFSRLTIRQENRNRENGERNRENDEHDQ